jgi:hypothetical protein
MTLLVFITAITLSFIAAWYSLIGLAAIFAAAVVPIIIMGGVLEVAKLVTASWLYRNWKEAPVLLKSYLSFAVVILMVITSMGIFGFLSKAHLDQAVPTGDIAQNVAFIDEQIATERDNITQAKSLIAQMDEVVNKKIGQEGRDLKDKNNNTYKEDVAERALSIRRSQAKDRAKYVKEIEGAQAKILELQQKKAPISSELRKIEAEVGPIKYIAALIYGDEINQSLLEKAVRGVIILIVSVFDPLAVLMLIAANWSLKQTSPKVEPSTNLTIDPIKKSIIRQPQIKTQPIPKKTKGREWLEPDLPKPTKEETFSEDNPFAERILTDEEISKLGRYEAEIELERQKAYIKKKNI